MRSHEDTLFSSDKYNEINLIIEDSSRIWAHLILPGVSALLCELHLHIEAFLLSFPYQKTYPMRWRSVNFKYHYESGTRPMQARLHDLGIDN